jgi:hypothetical protein
MSENGDDDVRPDIELGDDLLPEGCGCPNCGERRYDYLVWRADDSGVDCSTCGTFWNPNE